MKYKANLISCFLSYNRCIRILVQTNFVIKFFKRIFLNFLNQFFVAM